MSFSQKWDPGVVERIKWWWATRGKK